MDQIKQFLVGLLKGIFERFKAHPEQVIPTVAAALSIFIKALEQLKQVAEHHDAASLTKMEEATAILKQAKAHADEAAQAKALMAQVAQFTPYAGEKASDEGVSAA